MIDKKQLSVLVVAHNEEAQIEACLACLDFADEIVVLLDRSTDGTFALAKKSGAHIVEGAWEIEGVRRAAGVAACSCPFILEVDADERVTPALAAEIVKVVSDAEGEGADWWRIPFENYVGDRLVRYGWGAMMGVGAKACLFKRETKSWGNERVHPKVTMQGKFGHTLQNPMTHFLDRDLSDMIQRLDRYSTLHALDLVDTGSIGTLRKNVWRIFGRFWKCYVRRKGRREGGLGLAIAICAALYPFLSYMKAQELMDKKK